MKTLGEVIKANECCDHGEPDSRCEDCPYNGLGACCQERESNALYYLKEYHEHLKWQAYEEHCLAEEKKKIKQAYEQGYTQAKHDDAVARSWEESYRQSQMPWNHYTEMGG